MKQHFNTHKSNYLQHLTLFLALLILAHCQVKATVYFFSSSTGKDSYTTNSVNTPWCTLKKLNSIKLAPGDYVLLKGGDYFYGKIALNYSGTKANPITISTYGNSQLAIVNGSVPLTHWTPVSPGIYASDPIECESDVKNVIFDYKQAEQGRYPNDYPGTGGFLLFQSHVINTNNTATIYSQYTLPYGIDNSWAGATLKVKTYLATLESGKIIGIDNSTGAITYEDRNMFYDIQADNAGFYITNSLKTLDRMSEWYYNPKDKKLYMHFGVDNPNTHSVQVSTIDTLFQPKGSHILVSNIVFNAANKYAACNNWSNQSDLTFYNCKFLSSGVTAAAFANRSKLVFNYCTIDGANNSGIVAGYNCDSLAILNTTVNNIGMQSANYTPDSIFNKRIAYGIFSSGAPKKGLYMENCTVTNIGYIGVYFSGSNNYIYRNYFANTCMFLDDGGAIYYADKTVKNVNNIVRRNIVLNCQGYIYGYPAGQLCPNGIFVDDYGNNVLIDSNYVQKSGQSCLYIHNGSAVHVYNNTFIDSKYALFEAQDDVTGPLLFDLNMHNNYFYTANAQYAYRLCSSGNYPVDNYITQFGYIDYNYIATPDINVQIFHSDTFNYPGIKDRTLPTWKQEMPYDKHSIVTATANAQVKTLYAVYTDSTVHLQGVWQKLDGTLVRDSIRIPNHTGVILIQQNTYVPITWRRKSTDPQT